MVAGTAVWSFLFYFLEKVIAKSKRLYRTKSFLQSFFVAFWRKNTKKYIVFQFNNIVNMSIIKMLSNNAKDRHNILHSHKKCGIIRAFDM